MFSTLPLIKAFHFYAFVPMTDYSSIFSTNENHYFDFFWNPNILLGTRWAWLHYPQASDNYYFHQCDYSKAFEMTCTRENNCNCRSDFPFDSIYDDFVHIRDNLIVLVCLNIWMDSRCFWTFMGIYTIFYYVFAMVNCSTTTDPNLSAISLNWSKVNWNFKFLQCTFCIKHDRKFPLVAC